MEVKKQKKIDFDSLAKDLKRKKDARRDSEIKGLRRELDALREKVDRLERVIARLAPNDPDLREIMRQENPDLEVLEREVPMIELRAESMVEPTDLTVEILNPNRQGIQELYVSKNKPWNRRIGINPDMKRALRDLGITARTGKVVNQEDIFSILPKKILDKKPDLAVEIPSEEFCRIVKINDVEYVVWKGDASFAMELYAEGLGMAGECMIVRSDYSDSIREVAHDISWKEFEERIRGLSDMPYEDKPDGQVDGPLHEGIMDAPEPIEKTDEGDIEQIPEGRMDGPFEPPEGGFGGGFFG